MKYILAKKIEMTQIFDAEGKVIPVTLVLAGPCKILDLKTTEKNGYEAVEIGFEELKEKKVTKSIKTKPYRFLKEFRGSDSGKNIGDLVDVSVFNEGDLIKVSSISKGKGFQGPVKKFHIKG